MLYNDSSFIMRRLVNQIEAYQSWGNAEAMTGIMIFNEDFNKIKTMSEVSQSISAHFLVVVMLDLIMTLLYFLTGSLCNNHHVWWSQCRTISERTHWTPLNWLHKKVWWKRWQFYTVELFTVIKTCPWQIFIWMNSVDLLLQSEFVRLETIQLKCHYGMMTFCGGMFSSEGDVEMRQEVIWHEDGGNWLRWSGGKQGSNLSTRINCSMFITV